MDLVFAPSQIETWPLDRLRPYARNAKIHGTDQVAKIAASMAKFGWTVPCMVADDGELIAGHGRVLAAAMLGLKDVPVIRLSHLDEAERRAYRIADNKLTELGEWDEAVLRDEIAGLLAEDFDLSLLGITDEDLDALLRDPDQVDGGAVEGEDDIPEPPLAPVSVAGDLWQLGSHWLICGDSTSADVVGRLLGDVKPLLMVTDPPYGVEYDPSWRNQAGAAKTKHAGETLGGGGLRGADGTVHAKRGAGNAIQSHRIPDSVFRIMRHKGGLGAAGSHPAVFPVALVEAVLTAFSDPSDLIYEPFCGSGTQLVAAERAGRRCFAMELDPVYCDVAVRRWEMATGKTAELVRATGLFDNLARKDSGRTLPT